MWAGRDFHQRPQQGTERLLLDDTRWSRRWFNNLDFGGAKLDMGFVGQSERRPSE